MKKTWVMLLLALVLCLLPGMMRGASADTGETIYHECNKCHQVVNLEVIRYTYEEVYATRDTYHFAVVRCPNCKEEYSLVGNEDMFRHTGGTETPTCTTGKTCAKCGGKYGALGHDWGKWTSNGSGTHTRTCQRSGCGATDTGSCSGGDATCVTAGTCTTCGGSYYGGHTFSVTWSYDDSGHWKPCIYCDQGRSSEGSHMIVDNHMPEYLKSEANCVSPAIYYKSCGLCYYTSKTDTFTDTWYGSNPNNHDFSIQQYDDDNHWKKCSRCDATDAVNPHEWDNGKITRNPTCTKAGEKVYTCAECSKTKTEEISATGHDFVRHEAKAPTCTEIGWNAYDTCKNCDYTSYVEIKASGHDFVHHDPKAPTCTEIGWNAYDTCKNCDYTTYVEIKASGHNFVHHNAQAPTCTEIGWNAYDTCKNCDYTTYVEIPATGHDFTEKVVKPTCEAGGYTKYTCKTCDYSYTDHQTKKLLHWFAEWTSNGDGTHSAPCKREGCDHIGKAECASIEYTQNAGTADASTLSICPVCGDVSDGAHLALIDTAKAAGKHLPTGELTVRMGDTENGDKFMTVAFEYAGKLTQPEGEVEITLPAELLADYTLSIVNADGTETDLPCTTEDAISAFTLNFEKPESAEALPTAHLIRLIPKAA